MGLMLQDSCQQQDSSGLAAPAAQPQPTSEEQLQVVSPAPHQLEPHEYQASVLGPDVTSTEVSAQPRCRARLFRAVQPPYECQWCITVLLPMHVVPMCSWPSSSHTYLWLLQVSINDPACSTDTAGPPAQSPSHAAGMPYTPFPAAMEFAAASPAQMFGTAMVDQVFTNASPAWATSEPITPAMAVSSSQQQAAPPSSTALPPSPADLASPRQQDLDIGSPAVSGLQQATAGLPVPISDQAQEPQASTVNPRQLSSDPAPAAEQTEAPAYSGPPTFAAMAPPVSSHLAEPTPPPLRQQPMRYVPTPYPFSGVPATAPKLASPSPFPAFHAQPRATPVPAPMAAPAPEQEPALDREPSPASLEPPSVTPSSMQAEPAGTPPAAAESAARQVRFGAASILTPGPPASATPAAAPLEQAGTPAIPSPGKASPAVPALPDSSPLAATPSAQLAPAQLTPEPAMATTSTPGGLDSSMQAMLQALSRPRQGSITGTPPGTLPSAGSSLARPASPQQQLPELALEDSTQAADVEPAGAGREQSPNPQPADKPTVPEPALAFPAPASPQQLLEGQAGAEAEGVPAAPVLSAPGSPAAVHRPSPDAMLSPGAISIPSSPVSLWQLGPRSMRLPAALSDAHSVPAAAGCILAACDGSMTLEHCSMCCASSAVGC